MVLIWFRRLAGSRLSLALSGAAIIAFILWRLLFSNPRLGLRPLAPPRTELASPATSSDKHLVVAALKTDDISWTHRRLSGWTKSIYRVDDPTASLTVKRNKGREAMVYLTYIIDNYSTLPPIVAFMHGLQYQWHNDDSNYDSATVLSRLQIDYLQLQGYVNLRCVWVLGCPAEIHVKEPRDGFPTEAAFRDSFRQLFPEKQDDIPDIVAASCCAQFAVTSKMIRRNPKERYERWRRWIEDTELDDAVSGRIMEYSWHIIFGQPPVHCPNAQSCYCKVFGLCDMPNCTESGCEGWYILPQYSSPPSDWRELPQYA